MSGRHIFIDGSLPWRAVTAYDMADYWGMSPEGAMSQMKGWSHVGYDADGHDLFACPDDKLFVQVEQWKFNHFHYGEPK